MQVTVSIVCHSPPNIICAVQLGRNDKYFSCGLALSDPSVIEESRWQGENVLGKILVDLRVVLRNKRNQ